MDAEGITALNLRIELAVTGILVACILMGLYLTSKINLAFSSELETFSGPRAYPRLILAIILVLCLMQAVNQVRGLLRRSQTQIPKELLLGKRALWSVALMAVLFLFVLAFETVGYILTMTPLLILVAFLCGAQRFVSVALVAIVLAAACLMIFRYGLSTVLPEGLLGIDAVI